MGTAMALVSSGVLLGAVVLLGRAAVRDQRARRARGDDPLDGRAEQARHRREHADLARTMLFGRLGTGGGRLAIEERLDPSIPDEAGEAPGADGRHQRPPGPGTP